MNLIEPKRRWADPSEAKLYVCSIPNIEIHWQLLTEVECIKSLLPYNKQTFIYLFFLTEDSLINLLSPRNSIIQLYCFIVSYEKEIFSNIFREYSQTCLQQPPLGPQKSGRCSKVKA